MLSFRLYEIDPCMSKHFCIRDNLIITTRSVEGFSHGQLYDDQPGTLNMTKLRGLNQSRLKLELKS